ncbi:S8 family serine peptidase [Parvularcula dongshanensis]|uniref:Peptidase S8/S53 domain-containing protein n=1 Tax=Parvularcula dongshanensis TaxID=1173995 RepID=A0A840I2T0_9PROT|nr:S8 family serine peptidase [Parvularcula dongshanensis]MBB4659057.1 hypothetical protein [Parvularcula dongshanensis]
MSKALLRAGTALCAAAAAMHTPAASADDAFFLFAPAAPETTLQPRYGDIEAFYGDIEAFWGDASPFWGDIEPFWGDIEAFWGDREAFYGDIEPFYGDIEAFYGDIEAFWGDIEAFWGPDEVSIGGGDFASAHDGLVAMTQEAERIFGPAVEGRTGESFEAAFLTPFLDRYGIDLDDPSSLQQLSLAQRARFMLEFYDGLMAYSGRDAVDWWMGTSRWSPALAQTQGSSYAPVIGVIDSRIRTNAGYDVLSQTGYQAAGQAQGHGTAIASLIAAPHDGRGVMGVSPNVRLVVHNPFDFTGTTNWRDVQAGVRRAERAGAHVINLSLGTGGEVLDGGWANVIGHAARRGDMVVVKAAGNEGVSAQGSAWWDPQAISALLLVGSVGVDGEILGFSNRPGTACLLGWHRCAPGARLMDRFIVAPGEFLLAEDEEGGTHRVSGTSFAAPLVTGTVALLQSRWPWLQGFAGETAEIVLSSARDLGAPGTDPVYGRGLLDIEAAQAPLDWDALTFFAPEMGRVRSAGRFRHAFLSPGVLDRVDDDAVVYAYERIGRTFRDFQIPLKSRVRMDVPSLGGAQPAQDYLTARLQDWAAGAGFASPITEVVSRPGYSLSVTRKGDDGAMTYRQADGLDLTVGAGTNAPGSLLFAGAEDSDPRTGAVAPLAAFASGGGFAAASLPAGGLGTVTLGFSASDAAAPRFGFAQDPVAGPGVPAYQARTASLGVAQTLAGARLGLSYSRLDEDNGVLGTQGTGALSLGAHAVTRGVTAEVVLPEAFGVTLAATASRARTEAAEGSGLLTLSAGGALSTAYALRASSEGAIVRGDQVVLTLSQPLALAEGGISISQYEVVDRMSGELGLVRRPVGFDAPRPMITETSYAFPVAEGQGAVAALLAHDAAAGTVQAGLSFRRRF